MERIAECHCGQLRAITSGEPGSVYICHCKACQRRTGTIIHNGSRWLKSQVRIEGEHKIYGTLLHGSGAGRSQSTRIYFHVRRRYSGRPSSSMRFSAATAMATSVVCRPPMREWSASPITRL